MGLEFNYLIQDKDTKDSFMKEIEKEVEFTIRMVGVSKSIKVENLFNLI